MVHPYLINTLNALVLIVAGLVVYFLNPAKPPTALIAPLVGLLLLACTYHLRKHNRFVFNTVTALTLLVGFMIVWLLNLNTFSWNLRYLLLVAMAASCFLAVVVYVGTFIRERRLRDNQIYKDDL